MEKIHGAEGMLSITDLDITVLMYKHSMGKKKKKVMLACAAKLY